ncbi:MAG: DUF4956 domain-containing protein [Syntrophomonas sp.]
MLESILASTSTAQTLSITTTLLILAGALGLGLLISRAYIWTHKEEGYAPSFTVTLIMLPAIIAIIILMIGDNVARAFSLAGAFSLIRFRSAPGDPKDIAYVFFSLAVGLACGMKHVEYAALFAVVLCSVMLVLNKVRYASPRGNDMLLKITIPENLNYQSLFDDIFSRYTDSWTMKTVKTSDFGSLFKLVYRIRLKNDCPQKEFLDELRCRNGNLDIALTFSDFEDRVYL